MQVEVLQRQLSQASKLTQSQCPISARDQPVDCAASPSRASTDVERQQLDDDDALSDAEKQSRTDSERRETFERQQSAALERSASVVADRDLELSQLRGPPYSPI